MNDLTVDDIRKLTKTVEDRYKDEWNVLMGNCGTYAIALQRVIGGKVVGLAAEDAGMQGFGHVLVEWHDEDGTPYVVDGTKVIRMDNEASEHDYKRWSSLMYTVAEMGFGRDKDLDMLDIEIQYPDSETEILARTLPDRNKTTTEEIEQKLRFHLRQIMNTKNRGR